MANIYSHTKEAVRVKVKKCELNIPPEWRKFSVDPQITSLEVLYSLLAKAFDIKSDFAIKYKAYDPAGNEIYLAVLSDWDLDAAFLRIHNFSLQTATEPCLTLQIDIKPFTEVKEWDAETSPILGDGNDDYGRLLPTSGINSSSGNSTRELMTPLQQSLGASQKYVQSMQTKLPGLIMNQMEKTFSIVQKAFNLSEETMASLPPRAPLSDAEFRLFLDSLGQIQRCDELRKVIFLGGIDPSLRRVVWKHILNVYPSSMTGKQRMDYMRRKAEHYCKLRDTWKTAVKQGCVAGELSYVTSMVKKDVLRTDRLHPFYAGSDDNLNIAALFNILTTYALNHPTVSYCQGMSDIASPLLVTMNDEAQAYICFCAIMARLRVNFMLDGIAMTQKFAHLTEALSFYDPEFWEYLKSQQADDLLFCYRWLLLELKREFPFEDALRMLEVQWSSLKYEISSDKELALYEKEFVPILEISAPTTSAVLPLSPSYLQVKPRENAYTKVCALRRQSSSTSLSSISSSFGNSCNALSATQLDSTKRLNQSLDDNISLHAERRAKHAKAHQSLDESKMLILMEAMEATNSKEFQPSNNVETKEELKSADTNGILKNDANSISTVNDDEEVFESDEKKPFQHFNFHPTNPFLEDAQIPYNSSELHITSKSNVTTADAFLASNAIPLDERDNGDNDAQTRVNGKKVKSTYVPKSFMNLHNKNIISNYNAVSSLIVKQITNASKGGAAGEEGVADGDHAKRITSSGGGHFKELKEKIAATSKRGMTFDDLSSNPEKSQQRLVKNFNEFLNFATLKKSRMPDKFSRNTAATTTTTTITHTLHAKSKTPSPTAAGQPTVANIINPEYSVALHPLVQFSRIGCASSFDDSDSSSIPETTCSCSTAATAIQELNNLSNYSLHQELHRELDSNCNSTMVETSAPQSPTSPLDEVAMKQSLNNVPNDPSLTPDDSQEQDYFPMSTAITRELRLEAENLDRQVFGDSKQQEDQQSVVSSPGIEYEQLDKDSLDLVDELKENEIIRCPDLSELIIRRRERDSRKAQTVAACAQVQQTLPQHNERTNDRGKHLQATSNNSRNTNPVPAFMTASVDGLHSNPFIDESTLLTSQTAPVALLHTSSSLPEVIVPIAAVTVDAAAVANIMPGQHSAHLLSSAHIEMATNASEDTAFASTASSTSPLKTLNQDGASLPPPSDFGGGNPFLIFLCLTLLLQHRNTIIKSGMDYNEIAMHFDKMVRKHDVTRVLNQARRMYIDYLKTQTNYSQRCQAYPGDLNKNTNISAAVATTARTT